MHRRPSYKFAWYECCPSRRLCSNKKSHFSVESPYWRNSATFDPPKGAIFCRGKKSTRKYLIRDANHSAADRRRHNLRPQEWPPHAHRKFLVDFGYWVVLIWVCGQYRWPRPMKRTDDRIEFAILSWKCVMGIRSDNEWRQWFRKMISVPFSQQTSAVVLAGLSMTRMAIRMVSTNCATSFDTAKWTNAMLRISTFNFAEFITFHLFSLSPLVSRF